MHRFTCFRVINIVICLGLGYALNSCLPKAECEVIYDEGSRLCLVLLNPPGETGESRQDGSMHRSVSVSREPGGPLIQVANYELDLTRVFEESGNVYTIKGEISMEMEDDDADITTYDLTVTGGLYGEEPRHFTKP